MTFDNRTAERPFVRGGTGKRAYQDELSGRAVSPAGGVTWQGARHPGRGPQRHRDPPHLLRDHRPYTDLGAVYFETLDTAHLQRRYVQRRERLGYAVTLTPTAVA